MGGILTNNSLCYKLCSRKSRNI